MEYLNLENKNLRAFPSLINNLDEYHVNISYNNIKTIDEVQSNIVKLIIFGNPLEDISGIWKSNIMEIAFDQPNLFDEIELYCKLSKCLYSFYGEGRDGRLISTS